MSRFSIDPTHQELLQHTIVKFGPKAQHAKAAEEYAEVSAEISRNIARVAIGDAPHLDSLAEELADAEIMRQQLFLMNPELQHAVEVQYTHKLICLAELTSFNRLTTVNI